MSANHNFCTTSNMLPCVPAAHMYAPPWRQKGSCPECLSAVANPASDTVLKTSTWVSNLCPQKVMCFFKLDSVVWWTIWFYLHLSLYFYIANSALKWRLLSCGLIKLLHAGSRFTYENIFPPLIFFTSLTAVFSNEVVLFSSWRSKSKLFVFKRVGKFTWQTDLCFILLLCGGGGRTGLMPPKPIGVKLTPLKYLHRT